MVEHTHKYEFAFYRHPLEKRQNAIYKYAKTSYVMTSPISITGIKAPTSHTSTHLHTIIMSSATIVVTGAVRTFDQSDTIHLLT